MPPVCAVRPEALLFPSVKLIPSVIPFLVQDATSQRPLPLQLLLSGVLPLCLPMINKEQS